ncbi:MAG: ribonuclease catalytic domain-containing protein [Pseudomonadota bacterium]
MSSATSVVHFPTAGCIVEFMQGNRPQIAWILEEQKGKVRLFLPNRRETKLTTNRLLPWSGPVYTGEYGREAMVGILEEHNQKRELYIDSSKPDVAHDGNGETGETGEGKVNALELWEMVQGEVERASAEWFAELLDADPSVDTVATVGRALLLCKTHFKFQAGAAAPVFEIYDAEKVEARLVEQEATRAREALVEAGQSFIRTLWDVHCRKRTMPLEGSPEFPPAEVADRLAALFRTRMADPDDHETDAVWKLVAKSLPTANANDAHTPMHLATAWGIIARHHNFWMDRADYDAGNAWASEYIEEICALHSRVEALAPSDKTALAPSVEGLDNGQFISIDSATTRDIDDSFDIAPRAEGGYHLRVSLAAPVTAWDYDGPLDKAVLRRATSIYLPEGSHNMLPEELGTDFYSLVAGQVRPSLVIDIDVDADGEIIETRPQMTWVRLAANLTYEECEAVLADALHTDVAEEEIDFAALMGAEDIADANPLESQDHTSSAQNTFPLTPDNRAIAYTDKLLHASALMRQRQALRIKAGAVIIEREDPKITLEPKDNDIIVHTSPAVLTPHAQLVVSEMMILANASIAAWAKDRGIALLHRTQDVGIPKEYAGVWREPHHIAKVVKALSSACLETTSRPHAGIGVPAYSPITSPLRRYPDLINEEQIAHYLAHGAPRWTCEELDARLPLLSSRLDAAGQVQRFRPRYWKLLYIKQHDKEYFDAIVTEENDMFVFVTLPLMQIFVRGKRITFGEKVSPGQHFQVRLGKVNPLQNEIQIFDAVPA